MPIRYSSSLTIILSHNRYCKGIKKNNKYDPNHKEARMFV
jgi:hypothetical protein